MEFKTAGLRADLRKRATSLKADVAHLETLPIASRMMAGIGAALRGLHLVADFVLHVIPDEVDEVIDHQPAPEDEAQK